jgi:hypothetical protein
VLFFVGMAQEVVLVLSPEPTVLDDTTVLEQYGSLVERTAHRLISRTGLRSAYDDLWSALYKV